MLENLIIEKCGPTLANLKTGEIVTCRFGHIGEVQTEIKELNSRLEPKGVKIEILLRKKNSALLYVYREKRLARDMSCPMAAGFMRRQGYTGSDVNSMVERLKIRIRELEGGFPHEIGLFLSFPVEDVEGFIQNRGKNCRYCGYWKVYGEADKAAVMFARFDKCRMMYKKMRGQGTGIYKLTVAC